MDRPTRDKACYVFGSFRLDATRRRLTRDGAVVSLTPTVFDLLLHLVENAGRVVTKADLFEAVWPGRYLDESNLTTTVFVLRRALREAGEDQPLVATAPGQGYRLAAEVRRETPAPSPVADQNPIAEARPTLSPPVWRSRRVLVVAGLCAFLLAAGAVAIAVFAPGGAHPRPTKTIVVVAPFRNLTGDPIFDTTLATAEEIDLDQSPFLSVLTDHQVQDTLALMARSRDEALTVPVAREICARNNGLGVIDGAVARIGAKYLLTVRATDCAGGESLAAEKTQVDRREALIPALERLDGKVRARLGEPASSIRRFDAPLLPEKTASLEALRAFSQATWLNDRGHRDEAITLFNRAIEIDPNFAAAYASLSFVQFREAHGGLDAANIAKAYALRDTVGERERFQIVARYNQSVTRDLNAAVRELQAWTAAYPGDPRAWTLLASADTFLGRFPEAIAAARTAIMLNPDSEEIYDTLARTYLRSGDWEGVRRACALAAARGLAGEETHLFLLQAALANGDKAGVDREVAWTRGRHAEETARFFLGLDAFNRGEVRRGLRLMTGSDAPPVAKPTKDYAGGAAMARLLAVYGMEDRARRWLSAATPDSNITDYVLATAQVGDEGRALTLLAQELKKYPLGTLANQVTAPEVRGAIDLRHGRSRDAVIALAPTAPYERISTPIRYMRGAAFLAAGDAAEAVREFQSIVGRDIVASFHPVNPHYPMARLGLARAYRLLGDEATSRRYYAAVTDYWKDADPDVPVVRQARAEYAALGGAPVGRR